MQIRNIKKYIRVPPGTGDVKLSNVWCTGLEKSLLDCDSLGWGRVTSSNCLNHQNDVGVYCFQNVRVVGGVKNSYFMTGRVEVRQEATGQDWRTVCADGINQAEANVICREVHYDRAIMLAPSFFGSLTISQVSKYIADIKCKGNETSITDCAITTELEGKCSIAHYNYASVLCVKNSDKDQSFTVKLSQKYHGAVMISQFGQDGTVCVDGWDEREANVTCRQFGYRGGVVLGPQEVFTRRQPVWFSEFNCTGEESKLQDCPRTTKVSLQCVRSIKDAGVLCYNSTGVQVRLNGPKDYFGTVEVVKDGQVGTVCDYDWTKNDARVLCRELNFPDGRPYKRSFYGAGKGSVVLSGFFCDGKEDRLLDCSSRGWYNVQSYCNSHQNDASVYCYRRGNGICDTGFSNAAKTVVFRSLGMDYVDERAINRSANGNISGEVLYTNVKCSGKEKDFTECTYDFNKTSSQSPQKGRFHDEIIEHNSDGSIAVSNQLYDMTMQPTGAANGSAGVNLQLAKNGSAYYSKPLKNG
uniref:SRCR domain-containing protein n=1 Tax=Magallana gigas TaxID=29159 RepID=A0A8W8IB64_MAGGI